MHKNVENFAKITTRLCKPLKRYLSLFVFVQEMVVLSDIPLQNLVKTSYYENETFTNLNLKGLTSGLTPSVPVI